MPGDMPTPCCVSKYNSLMGGVDRMDTRDLMCERKSAGER